MTDDENLIDGESQNSTSTALVPVTFGGGREMIGKVLNINDPQDEPVFESVADKDREVGGIAVDRLTSYVERIERLNEEKKGISNDTAAVYAEAKSAGFDVKAIRAIIKLRAMNTADRDEQDFILDTYRRALNV